MNNSILFFQIFSQHCNFNFFFLVFFIAGIYLFLVNIYVRQ